jgi:para-aminobenzoate synthetase / 4-amino-4-deoxychorismate lyase
VLLETSRFDPSNRHSHLFLSPERLILARHIDEIPRLFAQIDEALSQGLYVAGFLSYECGYHFGQFSYENSSEPIAWFGAYKSAQTFDHLLQPESNQHREEFPDATSPGHSVAPDNAALEISKDEYVAQIHKIKGYLAAGETYQVNFTDRLAFSTALAPADVFDQLARRQGVAYSAFLNFERSAILSFSPELFFKMEGNRIWTRPMKGTMPRGLDLIDDQRMAVRLRNDDKNLSEHVMIVDLLRNDLGRICCAGSIKVENPFAVERYSTLHQMTSEVTGTLRPAMQMYDIFRALFPSGSITGAPKLRTMQIIRALESRARGVYTGAIGFMTPNRSAVFNVAIRTLELKGGSASMGVGGGIVADSDPEDEYRECLLKASFITCEHSSFDLIETILWDGELKWLDLHLNRLESSACYFDFAFDLRQTTSELLELPATHSFVKGTRRRIRLILTANGNTRVQVTEAPDDPKCIRAVLADEHTSSTDPFRRHKTTRRELYDRHYKRARDDGFDEVIFRNEKGELTEGAISNLFLKKSGRLLTPPIASGVLPGVFRRQILETNPHSAESVLTLDDLKSAEAIYLCNSIRGLRRVTIADDARNG